MVFRLCEKNCEEAQETKAAGLLALVVKMLPPRKEPENKNIFFLNFLPKSLNTIHQIPLRQLADRDDTSSLKLQSAGGGIPNKLKSY